MLSYLNKKTNIIVFFLAIINIILALIFEISCPWKTNFNIDCAGCGLTRMFKSLLRLNLYQAFRFNPLMFCLLVGSIIYLIYIMICILIKRNYYKLKSRDLIILLIIVIIFTIMRNIPMFDYLKPTIIK